MSLWDLLPAGTRLTWLLAALVVAACLAGAGVAALAAHLNADEHADDNTAFENGERP